MVDVSGCILLRTEVAKINGWTSHNIDFNGMTSFLGSTQFTTLNAYRLKYKWRFSYSSKHEYLAMVGILNPRHKGTHHVAI